MFTLSIYKLDSCLNDRPVCVLKEGEHVIGRGELLGCNDKRASKSHASIRIANGNATITSIHQNPCFFQAANSKTVVILSKDVPAELNEGDKFGIFPDQFWFRVKFHDDSLTNSNQSSSNGIIQEANETLSLHKRSLDEDCNTSHSKMLKFENGFNDCTSIDSLSISNKETEGVSVLVNSNAQTKEELSSSDNEDEHLNINTSKIIEIQTNNSTNSNDVDKPVSCESPSGSLQHDVLVQEVTVSAEAKTHRKEELSGSDNEEEQLNVNIENTTEIATNIVNINNMDEPDPQVASASGTTTDNKNVNPSDKKVRDKCWYGNNCYRKSLHHKKEFSHPGDSDYDSDPNDVRPVCSYGADCYRKNKDHRKDYKHPRTNKQMPPKRKRNIVCDNVGLYCTCKCCKCCCHCCCSNSSDSDLE